MYLFVDIVVDVVVVIVVVDDIDGDDIIKKEIARQGWAFLKNMELSSLYEKY